jgi:hypothetical protein
LQVCMVVMLQFCVLECLVWVSAGLPASACLGIQIILTHFDRAVWTGNFMCSVNEIQHSNICFDKLNYLPISWSFCFIGCCFYNILCILSTKWIKETYNGEAIYVGLYVLCHVGYMWLGPFEIRCHIRNCEISLWLMSGNDKAYCACSSDESLWICL